MPQHKKIKRKRNSNIVYISKKYKKKESTQVIFVVSISLILFLTSIVGSLIKINCKKKVPVTSIINGKIDTSSLQKAIIIRNEHVYKSTVKGEINYIVSENEKIKKGDIVLNIEDKNTTNNLKLKERKLIKTISNIQEQREEISAYSSDITNINNKIKSILDNSIHKFLNSEIKDIYCIKDNINSNMNFKNNILLNEDRGVSKEYINENIKLKKEIFQNISQIKAEEGGILSYKLDGFEDILKFDSIESLSKDQTNISVNNNLSLNKIVNIGDPIFKIIESNKWYICTYIQNKLIEKWEENKEIEIYIDEGNNFKPLITKIYKIIPGKKESYVILESRKRILDYLDKRTIFFKICDTTFTGLKLPKSAISEKTLIKVPKKFIYQDKIGKIVYKKSGGISEKVYVNTKNLKDIDKEYTYILENGNKLELNDIIINKDGNEYKLEYQKDVKGVFKVNNGIANFIPINKEEIIYGENDYIIISLNNDIEKFKLNTYDRIVSDIKNYNIHEGEKIN